jgi:hypothetical protein
MRVDLHIDRLILHGVAEGDSRAIAAALEQRLGALLAGGPPPWTDAARVDGGQFTPGATPAQTGRRIATAVYAGLSQ